MSLVCQLSKRRLLLVRCSRFTDQISALDAQGRVLSDPNVWDGPLAAEFRGSTWPETKAALDKAKEELEQLRGQLQKISQDIFSAGGGAQLSWVEGPAALPEPSVGFSLEE